MTIINNTPDGDETNEIKIEPVTKVTDPKVTKRYPKDIATRENIKHIFEKLSREQIIQLIFFLMFIFNINDSDLPNHQSPGGGSIQESPPTGEGQGGGSIEGSHLRTLKDENDNLRTLKYENDKMKKKQKGEGGKKKQKGKGSAQESKSTGEGGGSSREKSPPKKS